MTYFMKYSRQARGCTSWLLFCWLNIVFYSIVILVTLVFSLVMIYLFDLSSDLNPCIVIIRLLAILLTSYLKHLVKYDVCSCC